MALTSSTGIGNWHVLKSANSSILKTAKMVAISVRDDTEECALLVTDRGELFSIGKSKLFLLGLGDQVETTQAVQVQGVFDVAGVSICSKYGDALAFTHQGQLYTWGVNSYKTPTVQSALNGITIVDATCTEGHYLALTQDGKVYEWRGQHFNGVSGINTTPTLLQLFHKNVVVAIACGDKLSLAVTQHDKVYMWGTVYNTQKDTDMTLQLSEVDISDETVVKVKISSNYCVALTEDGDIYAWRCSVSSSSSSSVKTSFDPVQIGKNTGSFIDIDANNDKYVAIADTRSIYTWTSDDETFVYNICTEIHQIFEDDIPLKFVWVYKGSDSITVDHDSFEEEVKEKFNNKEFSDLTLVVDNKRIFVHKFLLSLRSKFFSSMLQEHWTDKNQSEVELTSFSYEVYLSYFWYIYTREIKSNIEHLLELWSLAHAYREKKLLQGVEKMIKRNFSTQELCLNYSKVLMTIRNFQKIEKDLAQKKEDLEKLKKDYAEQRKCEEFANSIPVVSDE